MTDHKKNMPHTWTDLGELIKSLLFVVHI